MAILEPMRQQVFGPPAPLKFARSNQQLTVKLLTFITELEKEKRMEYISSIERVRSEQKFVEGAQVGKLDMLRRLLARRFGDLPPVIQALLVKASSSEIEVWFDRGLEAQTLDEVFQGAAH